MRFRVPFTEGNFTEFQKSFILTRVVFKVTQRKKVVFQKYALRMNVNVKACIKENVK